MQLQHDKKSRTYGRYSFAFVLLLLILGILFVWNINSGSVSLTVKEIFQILISPDRSTTASAIIWEIRLPRILAVIILGGALSVSGFLLQTFFGNLRRKARTILQRYRS